ncbi:MAG TPA: Lrp/AsnC ligand binding domain-containing protein [Nitrososphaerales archaeon]|nr:Lrp/AsnC ligand binding domain-containing protein [Nitrososphaerales archaeon]
MNLFVEAPLMDQVIAELSKLPSTEELYEVTGEFDVTCIVSTADMDEFRDILVDKIMKIKGIKSTVTSIVLYSSVKKKR